MTNSKERPHIASSLVRGGAMGVALFLVATSSVGALSSSPLAPAPNSPLGTACRHALVHDADGNVTPLRCSPTRFNIQAWHWYARVRPAPVLALARDSSLKEVERALCRVQSATVPMRLSEYTLASTYNDWHFSMSAVLRWVSTSCS